MGSLVLELQQHATDGKTPVTDLLRQALVIATKLKLPELREWVWNELNGYGEKSEVPPYRRLRGRTLAFNSMQGRWIPFIWEQTPPDCFTSRDIGRSIAEIENLLHEENTTLHIPYPDEVERHLTQHNALGLVPSLVVQRSSLAGIIDAVRNVILEWSLKLEQDGVLGQNMTFSPDEQQRAAGHTYNIHNFAGVLGDVKGETIQIGDNNAVYAELKRRGVSDKEQRELQTIVESLKTAPPEQKKNLLMKGTAWVLKNADKIGALSETIRAWFETSPTA